MCFLICGIRAINGYFFLRDKGNPDNLRAITEAVMQYGMY